MTSSMGGICSRSRARNTSGLSSSRWTSAVPSLLQTPAVVGGSSVMWYGVPHWGQTHRPATRLTSASSGTSIRIARATRSPVSASSSSRASAWAPGAREAVEHDARRRRGLAQRVGDHPDRDLVGHQLAAAHVALGHLPEGRSLADGAAEQVAGGQVQQSPVVGQGRGLGPLAGAHGAEEDVQRAPDRIGHRMNPS